MLLWREATRGLLDPVDVVRLHGYAYQGVGVDAPDGTKLFEVSLAVLGTNRQSRAIEVVDGPTPSEATSDLELASLVVEPGRVLLPNDGQEILRPKVEIELDRERGLVWLRVWTERGPTYMLESAEALRASTWQEVNRIAGDGSVRTMDDERELQASRFYRVRVLAEN